MVVRLLHDDRGQATVELAFVIPLLLVLLVIVTNCMMFFSDCAAFDRISRNTIRVIAASPSNSMTTSALCAQIEEQLASSFDDECTHVSVNADTEIGSRVCFNASLFYEPNLFGVSFENNVFGVSLPNIKHTSSLVVDVYRVGGL